MSILSLHASQMGMVLPWEYLQRSRKYNFQCSGCRAIPQLLSCVCRRFLLTGRFLWKLFTFKIYDLCKKLFEKSKPTARLVAQVIGNIVASFPAMPLGPLFYRAVEKDKIVRLKRYKQNYDAEIELSNEACSEFVWWKHNIKNSF